MSNNYWIKLYHEMLDDPKMGRLPDNVYRRCIEIFLFAGKLDDEGNLPDTDDLAWHLRRLNIDEFRAELEHLESVGILTKTESGWLVTNFAKRQAAVGVNERMRDYRKRKALEEIHNQNGHQPKANEKPVTDGLQDDSLLVTRSVTGRNTEVEVDIESESKESTNPLESESTNQVPSLKPFELASIFSILSTFRIEATADDIQGFFGSIAIPAGESFEAWVNLAGNQAKEPTWKGVRTVVSRIATEGGIAGFKAKYPPPKLAKPPGEHQQLFAAIQTACAVDLDIAGQTMAKRIAQLAGKLSKGRYTADDVTRFGEWWYVNDWRGQKGQPPKPNEIGDEWGNYQTYKTNGGKIINGRTDKAGYNGKTHQPNIAGLQYSTDRFRRCVDLSTGQDYWIDNDTQQRHDTLPA